MGFFSASLDNKRCWPCPAHAGQGDTLNPARPAPFKKDKQKGKKRLTSGARCEPVDLRAKSMAMYGKPLVEVENEFFCIVWQPAKWCADRIHWAEAAENTQDVVEEQPIDELPKPLYKTLAWRSQKHLTWEKYVNPMKSRMRENRTYGSVRGSSAPDWLDRHFLQLD